MQNTVDNPECSAVVGQSFVTEPINVGNIADNAYGQNERDNLCQRPQSSSCCINIVFGFGGKSKSDATIPDVVGCRSPSFALIGYGICLESEKIYTFVGEYSKGACLNIHHSLFPAVKRGNLNGKQAGRLNFVHRLCGVRSDCFRVFHDLTAADCSPYIFKIFCYLCHCNKGTPTYSRPVQ